jgi:hypothetical protein
MADFGNRILRRLGLEMMRRAPIPMFKKSVHYLHIGKTAGTQIGHAIKQINSAQHDTHIVKNGHGTTLRSVPATDSYFFSIRDPIARFQSGFYSRKRCGRPRLNNPWSPSEALLFQEFEHANDLAESLFCTDPRGRKALAAMLTIGHLGASQIDWFKKSGDIFSLRPPIWIIRQEHLEADLNTFVSLLGIRCDLIITRDPILAHANDYTNVPPMSELAIANLKRWHSADFQFYAQCEAWMLEKNPS